MGTSWSQQVPTKDQSEQCVASVVKSLGEHGIHSVEVSSSATGDTLYFYGRIAPAKKLSFDAVVAEAKASRVFPNVRSFVSEGEKDSNDWHRSMHTMHERFVAPFAFEPIPGRTLTLTQSKHALGASVWDSALVMSKYFAKRVELVKGKRAIELGSGTGLVGMAAALLGAHVVLTDQFEVLEHLQENVAANNLSDIAPVRELSWGSEGQWASFDGPYELIFASDVLYDDTGARLLAETFWLLADCNSVIFLAYESHKQSSEVAPDELDPQYRSARIRVLRLYKQPAL
eukprot:gnl/Hemi2/9411_TR3272_c0_g8_i1.p1 gnl/Hemi2/9411_TR3272_c0_g8~~gnl/Hemi2/9411_TR3272_c0_g8_i1.p1  ORF type:complete len:287 (-),score=21.08 gnl/Hemi2/9411_TR3272_c0_g8_i1:132-992(-)